MGRGTSCHNACVSPVPEEPHRFAAAMFGWKEKLGEFSSALARLGGLKVARTGNRRRGRDPGAELGTVTEEYIAVPGAGLCRGRRLNSWTVATIVYAPLDDSNASCCWWTTDSSIYGKRGSQTKPRVSSLSRWRRKRRE